MGLKSEERTIGEYIYTINQLPAPKGMALLTRLYKLAGPTIAQVLGAQDADKLRELTLAHVAHGIVELADRISEEDLERLYDTFAAQCTYRTADGSGGKMVDVIARNEHFAGRYDDYFKWLVACLEVNYSSFFDVARGALAGVAAAKGSA